MKKTLAVILVVLSTLVLAACGNSNAATATNTESKPKFERFSKPVAFSDIKVTGNWNADYVKSTVRSALAARGASFSEDGAVLEVDFRYTCTLACRVSLALNSSNRLGGSFTNAGYNEVEEGLQDAAKSVARDMTEQFNQDLAAASAPAQTKAAPASRLRQ
jgi:hypothetical protein